MTVKRIFITGIAGFIGFHLARHLHARGDQVIGIDNFNDYYSQQLKRDRAQELHQNNIPVITGDICKHSLLHELMLKHKTTHFVHLAAQPGVRYSLINPQAYIEANINGFINVLEACRLIPEVSLTYASSSSVYGTNTKIPFSIHDNTDHQASFYGVTKKTNELMAYAYHHLYKMPVCGLRFFTVYGPWGRPDMAVYSFTKAIDEGKPIDVYNFGKMQRDFTYIDDIIRGTTAAIDLRPNCELFNLGNHRPESVLTLIGYIEKALGKKAEIRLLPIQPGDVESTYADIQLSQEMLDFVPSTTLETGICNFVDWYLKYKKDDKL